MPRPTGTGDEELLEVGRIARAHGLRGDVVVELSTNRTERVAPGASLVGPQGPLEVVRASPLGEGATRSRWLVSFEGVDDRDGADALRGALLRAAPLPDEGVLWAHTLIGAEVADREGAVIGVVESLEVNPASDLLVLRDGRLIPLAFVVAADPARLTVELPPGLLDL